MEKREQLKESCVEQEQYKNASDEKKLDRIRRKKEEEEEEWNYGQKIKTGREITTPEEKVWKWNKLKQMKLKEQREVEKNEPNNS